MGGVGHAGHWWKDRVYKGGHALVFIDFGSFGVTEIGMD
jgi:hypothetical protein